MSTAESDGPAPGPGVRQRPAAWADYLAAMPGRLRVRAINGVFLLLFAVGLLWFAKPPPALRSTIVMVGVLTVLYSLLMLTQVHFATRQIQRARALARAAERRR